MDGPVRFPTGPKDLMVKVEQIYKAFFRVWNATMVPKLLPQPKWFKEGPELKPGDIIYFQKTENELSSDWTVGQVHYVTRSRDGVIRRVCVKYFNHKENKPRFTDRAVRSLVKLFSIEDSYFMHDMDKVEKLMTDLKQDKLPERVEPTKLQRNKAKEALIGVSLKTKRNEGVVSYPNVYERDFFETADISDFESEHIKSSVLLDQPDGFFDMLLALETNFNLEGEGLLDEDILASVSTA